MMKAFRHILIITRILLTCTVAGAQIKGNLIEQSLDFEFPFTISHYTTKHGLPQNQVVDIIAKKNGNLIIGTANGIVEYDGNEFVSFIKHDDYKVNIIKKIFWHEPSQQLMGEQSDGILRLLYPGNKVLGYYTSHMAGNNFFSIDPLGNIYTCNFPGIAFKEIAKSNVRKAKALFFYNNRFYIGAADGLYCYNRHQQKTTKLAAGNYMGFAQNPYDGHVYGIEEKTIVKLGEKIEKIFELDILHAHCQDITFTETGKCYIATTVGLYEKGEGYIRQYTKNDALPSENMQTLYYNLADQSLYIGSSEKGLLRLQFKNCFTYSASQGFPGSCYYTSIIRNNAGHMLVAGSCGFIYRIEKDTVYPYIPVTGQYCSLTEVCNTLYGGTWSEGVKILSEKKHTASISKQNGQLPWNSIHALFRDSQGTFWVGTGFGIAMGKSIAGIKPYLPGKIINITVCFFERKNGQLCIGGSEGLYILDKEYRLVKHLDKKQGLKGKEVRGLYEDREGKLWIGTYDGGIYCYDKDKLTRINNFKNTMLDIDAFCFAPDDYGYLYITGNHGLWRIREKDLDDFYKGRLKYLVPFIYSEEEGLLNTEFNGGFQNNYASANQRLYFSNIQGVVSVLPEKPVFRKLFPVIENIFVNGNNIHPADSILPRNTSSVRFDFSSTSFLSKYNIYYQYKISRNGQKAQWGPLQKNRSVNFYSLQPGRYVFTVRAIDAFNDREPNEVSYAFEITPYFYETTWFIVTMVLVFFIAITWIGRMRIQMYRRKAEEKERNKRRLAELELKAIHARMNPHFVFNSLNSIKYYLSVDDKKNANKYLDGFSMLLRKFTEYSSQDFITVQKEMEIIGTYVELEQMRMNNAFDAKIEVDPHALDMLIPTINLQPFVENAIKHGMAHASYPGFLHITVKAEEEDMITCVIDDNGIGRTRSQEINASRRNHISSGIQMIEEKKQIIEALYKIGITITIEDKMNAQGESMGTTVTIKIPVKHD